MGEPECFVCVGVTKHPGFNAFFTAIDQEGGQVIFIGLFQVWEKYLPIVVSQGVSLSLVCRN